MNLEEGGPLWELSDLGGLPAAGGVPRELCQLFGIALVHQTWFSTPWSEGVLSEVFPSLGPGKVTSKYPPGQFF